MHFHDSSPQLPSEREREGDSKAVSEVPSVQLRVKFSFFLVTIIFMLFLLLRQPLSKEEKVLSSALGKQFLLVI